MMHNAVMQDSGVEWIGGIPHDWQLDRLKDMVSLRNEKSTEKSDVEDYLELEDLEQGTGRLLSIRNTTNVESAVMKFYKGDVLFCKLRPYLRKYHLATFDGKCTGEILAFKPERIDPKFLLYFIASDGFIKICTAMSYGAKMPRVNYPKQLALLPVCFPFMEEQQAIAQYLELRCGKLDSVIAIKQQQIKALDALRESIIFHAVTKGLDASVPLIDSGVEWLGKIPQRWKVSKLRYEISIKNGDFISNKLDDESEYPVVGGNGFMGRTDDFNVKGDVIVIGRVGAYCGNVHYINEKSWVSDNALIVDTGNNKRFFTYLLNAFNLNSIANKTAQPVVTATNIKAVYIPKPSLPEQQSIVDHLDQETQRLNALKENLSQQISTLQAYKKALIYECVTGKKRINADVLNAG